MLPVSFPKSSPLLQQVKLSPLVKTSFLFRQGCALAFYHPVADFCECFQELFADSFKFDFPEKLCVLTALSLCHFAICSLWVIYECAGAVQNLLLPSLANILFVPSFPYLFIRNSPED